MSSKSVGRGIVKSLIFGFIVLLAPVALLAGGIEAVGYYRFHGMDQRIQIATLEYARTGKMPPSLWKPHPIWHHGLNPDHEINHLNKFGFRGFDFPKQKRPSELRLICVGDSTTQGWPLPFDLAYPYFLERFLSVALKDRVVNVINAGIGSHLSAFNLSYLGNYLLDFSPDYVLIKSAYNDYAPFSYAAFEGDYTVAFPRIFDIETYPSPATFWTRHTYIGKYLVARRLMGTQVRMAVDGNFGGTSVDVIENNLKHINSYTSKIRAMAAAVSANGATPILLDLPVSEKPEYTPDWFRKIIGAFNGELDRVSREMKVKLIRTAPQVAGADFFDQCHNSSQGHQRIAAQVANEILAGMGKAARFQEIVLVPGQISSPVVFEPGHELDQLLNPGMDGAAQVGGEAAAGPVPVIITLKEKVKNAYVFLTRGDFDTSDKITAFGLDPEAGWRQVYMDNHPEGDAARRNAIMIPFTGVYSGFKFILQKADPGKEGIISINRINIWTAQNMD